MEMYHEKAEKILKDNLFGRLIQTEKKLWGDRNRNEWNGAATSLRVLLFRWMTGSAFWNYLTIHMFFMIDWSSLSFSNMYDSVRCPTVQIKTSNLQLRMQTMFTVTLYQQVSAPGTNI